MKPSENGTYRWRYSVNLYKNPGLLWLFYKVFGGIFAGCLLFGLFLSDFKVSLAGAMWTSVGFAVMIAIVTLSYYVYALIQGGRYTWDFEMDEKGVNAVQAPNEAKRTVGHGDGHRDGQRLADGGWRNGSRPRRDVLRIRLRWHCQG